MALKFTRLGIIGKATNPEIKGTLDTLVALLADFSVQLTVEKACSQWVQSPDIQVVDKEQLGQLCDLLIVVGGDGSLLNAARQVVDENIPVVGINRGRLGFLTDISPKDIKEELIPILKGHYFQEKRFLLSAQIERATGEIEHAKALNDIVLFTGNIARMIEFEVHIDHQLMNCQRADGLITSTPTGSTAYALSGGGPILHPSLEAIALVPMHPHTLTSRPIVVSSNSQIEIRITATNLLHPNLSFDGQNHFKLNPEDTIHIRRSKSELNLIHPTSYDYFHTLRTKLGWSREK